MSLDLKVKISTVGELSGVKDVEQSLERALGKAKALGKGIEEINRLENQLGSVKKILAESSSQFAEKAKVAEVATMGFSGAISKVWASLRGLAYVLPGVGIAGITAAIAAGIGAVFNFATGIADLKEEAKRLKEEIELMHDSLVKTKTDAAEYQAKLKLIGTDAKTAADNLKSMNDEIDRQKTQEQQLLDKQKAVEMAKAGGISDPIARKQKEFEIEEKYAGKSATLERQAIQKKMDADEEAYQQAIRDREFYAMKVAETQGDIRGISGQLSVAGSRSQAEREKALKLRSAADSAFDSSNATFYGPYSSEQRAIAKKRAEEAEAAAVAQERIAALTEQNQIALKGQLAGESARLSVYTKGRQSTLEFIAGEEANRMGRLSGYKGSLDTINRSAGLDSTARGFRQDAAISAEIDRLNKDSERLREEKARLEAEHAKLVLDLDKTSMSVLRASTTKINEVNNKLKELGDAIRALNNPSTNNRLP